MPHGLAARELQATPLPEITTYTIWLYFRFPLSLRFVGEMLVERGIMVP
jgi:putative transposase